MPPKRKRRDGPEDRPSPWSWVGAEVLKEEDITRQHRLTACSLTSTRLCPNKYDKPKSKSPPLGISTSQDDKDVIVISDDEDEDPMCNKKVCKNNTRCLNYIGGLEDWENVNTAKKMFLKAYKLGENPILDSKEPDLPIGLRNLGATCYANASLQVWFRDLAFRRGVYLCTPRPGEEAKFKESPIFQLQVTFAALQESTQSVFNPNKLVESLQLSTAEQQDAQEFSKLFMSHLDAEFKKQTIPGLRSLVSDQFEGKQVYGTRCENCQNKSERATDFLELEINFQKNSKLEDCITELLKPERLTGDNKYLCSRCGSLQDATRYTQLQSLPPVLHFSLLRFIFDLKTLERKKSKFTIEFPQTLVMDKFLGERNTEPSSSFGNGLKDDGNPANCGDNVYELRGVLLHKGASAHHGHYEAQVFDEGIGSWFQFNDETVTRIKKLGDRQKKVVFNVDDDDTEKLTTYSKKHRAHARKRQRVEDSEEETAEELKSPVTSRDAYMLVYARKPRTASGAFEKRVNDSSSLEIPPPRDAMEVVQGLNASHDAACETYAAKEKVALTAFNDLRGKVREIYRIWNVNPDTESDCMVVSQRALESWLSKRCMDSSLQSIDPMENLSVSISNEDIVCTHKKLDHRKSANMKQITRTAYQKIVEWTHCSFESEFGLDDVCEQCIEDEFREKLYQVEHPRLVQQYDGIVDVDSDDVGYWISKAWLKDWRLTRPKMHVLSEKDPPPDSSDYLSDVECEHGGLTCVITTRRRISGQEAEFLKSLFPFWDPFPTSTETCIICQEALAASKEDNLELRQRAENEKANLSRMYSYANETSMCFLDDTPLALVPLAFVKEWRHWAGKPKGSLRPEGVDNSWWFCEHQQLIYDPNYPGDMEGMVAILRSEWEFLATRYPAGPLIAIRKHAGDADTQFDHEITVCHDCFHRRKSDWLETDVTVRLLTKPARSTTITAPATNTGSRQSTRLRRSQQHGEKKKVHITKKTTLMQFRIELQRLFNIPVMNQRLSIRDKELVDNSLTADELGILANEILDLREELELSDGEGPKRAPENGFGGTLLGRNASIAQPSTRACPTCTLENALEEKSCTVCGHTFIQ